MTIGKQRILTKEFKYEVSPHWTMGHNFIPRSTVSSSWASIWQESWQTLRPKTRDSKEFLLINTIWGIWTRGTVSSSGPVQLSLYYLLLPLIRDPTQSNMKTIDSELCVGELHKGPMFRLSDRWRETPAFCLQTNFKPLLHRGWKDIGELATKQVLFGKWTITKKLWQGSWDLTATSLRVRTPKNSESAALLEPSLLAKFKEWTMTYCATKIKSDKKDFFSVI